MCVCACVHVFIHVYVCPNSWLSVRHLHNDARTDPNCYVRMCHGTRLSVISYPSVYACLYVCVCMDVCMDVCVDVHIMYVCTSGCMHVCKMCTCAGLEAWSNVQPITVCTLLVSMLWSATVVFHYCSSLHWTHSSSWLHSCRLCPAFLLLPFFSSICGWLLMERGRAGGNVCCPVVDVQRPS